MRAAPAFLILTATCLLWDTPAVAQGFITYNVSTRLFTTCKGRVPDHPAIPVPREGSLIWTGRCVDGWMEGSGELNRYRGSTMVEHDLTQMRAGIRHGSNASLNVDPGSSLYQSRTYSRWRDGFPYGEIRIYSRSGVVLNVLEADGRGGIVQTMNPLNPILRMFGREAGQMMYLLRLFTSPSVEVGAANTATCRGMMRSQGYTDDTAQLWCGP